MKKSNFGQLLDDKILAIILLPLMALMAPFLVFPIEFYLPYPHVVEEIPKAILVYFLLEVSNKKQSLKIAIILGVLFSVSETILYTFNFFMLTSLGPLIKRLILTSILHSLTIVVMLLIGMRNKKLLPFGLLLGIFIHYLYNLIVL